MGAGQARITPASRQASNPAFPKTSFLITPIPVSNRNSFSEGRKPTKLKSTQQDKVVRINVGPALTRWRLHRSAYSSKLSSPARSNRLPLIRSESDGPDSRNFQQKLQLKLEKIVFEEGSGSENQTTNKGESSGKTSRPPKLTKAKSLKMKLHNRRSKPTLIFPPSSPDTDTKLTLKKEDYLTAQVSKPASSFKDIVDKLKPSQQTPTPVSQRRASVIENDSFGSPRKGLLRVDNLPPVESWGVTVSAGDVLRLKRRASQY